MKYQLDPHKAYASMECVNQKPESIKQNIMHPNLVIKKRKLELDNVKCLNPNLNVMSIN